MEGIGVSNGIEISKVLIKDVKEEIPRYSIEDISAEILRFKSAVEDSIKDIENLILNEKLAKEEMEIFDAHICMLKDEEFLRFVEEKIKTDKINSEWALEKGKQFFVELFNSFDNEYFKERSIDLIDIINRATNKLLKKEELNYEKIEGKFVLVAHDLTPSETVKIDKNKIIGFITEIGGKTSHVAIVARMLGIPAIVGAKNILSMVDNQSIIAMDGGNGQFIINPTQYDIESFNEKKKIMQIEENLDKDFLDKIPLSKDMKRFQVACNLQVPTQLDEIVKNNGEGIGLLRSEFIYMDRKNAPTEDIQFEIYKDIAVQMKEKPVIIRTLDVGGDKEISYLNIPKEENPFLGLRATRYCLKEKKFFKTQLRAILRASNFGKVKIMFPMISSLKEIREAKNLLQECKKELDYEKIKYDEDIEIGIMIEVPSAAIISDILAKEVDFFSIGTNDLIQYTVAVDRLNNNVSDLYSNYNLAVLRLIKMVIENGHKNGIYVGMCGEAARDVNLIPIFMAMGLDEFSVNPSYVCRVKRYMSRYDIYQCEKLCKKVLSLETDEEIEIILEEFENQNKK
ncbi:phosphoenolpyruvate--protein phosphotransferase [Clostridium senegalense]|uniref:Phosphoenolpyruvate-protein phosphotransferase n=1 Tax=Clostridium senegalense TaxID=1465809 RepID=A0A6M0H2Z3_9CLOT|nr:phosphoenolpyruvate--protein phosphotransferase [Clostridium senegalense]NEU05140.1 phosphoenolpyruvate--protein phosphotransferase [Clostridium senegalense]